MKKKFQFIVFDDLNNYTVDRKMIAAAAQAIQLYQFVTEEVSVCVNDKNVTIRKK